MSMNVLVVKYTPREEESRTKALLEYVIKLFPEDYIYQEVDLAYTLPELMDRRKIALYYRRNYDQQPLTEQEEAELSQMDSFADQLVQTDILIVACPLYNFGVPAPVKAWIDASFQRGKTFDVTESNGVVPLCDHLRVLSLYTAGIVFDEVHNTEGMNTIESLFEANFRWIGATDIRIIGIEGLDMVPPEEVVIRTKEAHRRITDICYKWFQQ